VVALGPIGSTHFAPGALFVVRGWNVSNHKAFFLSSLGDLLEHKMLRSLAAFSAAEQISLVTAQVDASTHLPAIAEAALLARGVRPLDLFGHGIDPPV
jgi:hypothetical protein